MNEKIDNCGGPELLTSPTNPTSPILIKVSFLLVLAGLANEAIPYYRNKLTEEVFLESAIANTQE